MENTTNALLPTKIDGRSVMKTIKQSDPLDLAIWKLMSDSRKRSLQDIGLELREYGFRQEDVKDRVVALHCSANRRWFNSHGSGKNTTYQLRKNRLERPFARGGVDIECISNIRDVLVIADAAAQVFTEVDAKPTEGNEVYKELMSSQGFNPWEHPASNTPTVMFTGKDDFDLDSFLAKLPHEIDKNDAEWFDIIKSVADDHNHNIVVVVNALGKAGIITQEQLMEGKEKLRQVPDRSAPEVDLLSNGQPFVSHPGALDKVRSLVKEQWPDAKILNQPSDTTLPNKSSGETEFSDGARALQQIDPSFGKLSPDTLETILNAPAPAGKVAFLPTETGSAVPQAAEATTSQNQETNMSQFPLDPTAQAPKNVLASIPVYKRDDIETAIIRLLRLSPGHALAVREIADALEKAGFKQPYSGFDYRVRKMLAAGVIARNPEKNANSVWTHYFVPMVSEWAEKTIQITLELVNREKEIAESGEPATAIMEVFNTADTAPSYALPKNDWLIRPETEANPEDSAPQAEDPQPTAVPYSKEPVIVIRGLILSISEAKELKQFVEKQSEIKVPGFLAKTKMQIQGIEFTFEQIEEIGFELASLF